MTNLEPGRETDPPTSHPPTAPHEPRRSPAMIVVLALAIPATVAAALAALVATGAFDPDQLLIDPGVIVTRGLPIARSLHDVAATVTIGLLLAAAFLIPVAEQSELVRHRAIRWASWGSAVWALAAAAVLVFTAANAIGSPLTAPTFPAQLGFYVTQLELGQTLLTTVVCAAIVHLITLFTPERRWTVAALALALFALLPLSLSGHAAGSDEHANAVNSLAVHLLGVTVWAGGLVAVVILARGFGSSLPTVLDRYSTVAIWAFSAVAVSGIVNATLRLSEPGDLLTPYGLLLTVKAGALVALGFAGAWHRARIIPMIREDPHRRAAFLRLAVGEIVVMAVTIGVSVALSLSETPAGAAAVNDPRRNLLGYPYPADFTAAGLFTQWHFDWIGAVIAVLAAVWYLRRVQQLARKKHRWPTRRTVAWLAGCITLLWATNGGPGVYAQVHFSTHLGQHLLLMTLIPVLFVLGRPFDLAQTRASAEATPFPREFLVRARITRWATRPWVAFLLYFGTLAAFYGTDWFEYAMFFHQGHVAMVIVSTGTGLLLATALLRQSGSRSDRAERWIVCAAVLGGFAGFGWVLRGVDVVLAPSWWTAMEYTDTAVLLADQRVGAAIASATAVLIALAIVFAIKPALRRPPNSKGRI